MCLNIGTPNNHHSPFGTNGEVVVLGVPILKHFRVVSGDNSPGHVCFRKQILKPLIRKPTSQVNSNE